MTDAKTLLQAVPFAKLSLSEYEFGMRTKFAILTGVLGEKFTLRVDALTRFVREVFVNDESIGIVELGNDDAIAH